MNPHSYVDDSSKISINYLRPWQHISLLLRLTHSASPLARLVRPTSPSTRLSQPLDPSIRPAPPSTRCICLLGPSFCFPTRSVHPSGSIIHSVHLRSWSIRPALPSRLVSPPS
nr:hypothetical protein Iba_chr14eCG0900 [Ipomoea batatas]